MILNITKSQIEAIGVEPFNDHGYTEDQLRWSRDLEINLAKQTRAKVVKLRTILEKHAGLPRMRARLAEIDRWLAVLDNPTKTRVKKIKDFAGMLKQYLKPAPKHWIYAKRGTPTTGNRTTSRTSPSWPPTGTGTGTTPRPTSS